MQGITTKPACEEYSNIVNLMSGWLFADMLNYHVKGRPIILENEARDGSNLSFAATGDWLKANKIPNRFSILEEDALKYIGHVSECGDERCKKAYENFEDVQEIMSSGYIKILENGKKISLSSLYYGKRIYNLDRGSGWGNEIDALKPYFMWFNGENKEKWVWP